MRRPRPTRGLSRQERERQREKERDTERGRKKPLEFESTKNEPHAAISDL